MPGQEGEIRKLQRELGLDMRIETPNLGSLQTRADRRVDTAKTVRHEKTVRPEKPNGSKRPPESSGASLYVGNLPWKTTDDQLAAMFSAHGPVETATISTQRTSGRSKGFGFVEMPESHHARAISALDGFKYEGRVLSVRPAW
jgi:RNA recognition motif-containing protein